MPAELSSIPGLARVLQNRVPRQVDDPGRTLASVAVILLPDPDALLLIRRAERAGDPWSGQMALPGGRHDQADPDLRHTAIRETREEIGLELDPTAFIGLLDDMAPSTPVLPPVNVRPHVFALKRRPDMALLTPSDEVALVTIVPLRRFQEEGIYRPLTVDGGAVRVQRMGYHLPEGVVWGMTERILTPLFRLLPKTS